MSRYPLVPLAEALELDVDEVDVEVGETYVMAGVYSFGRGLFMREELKGEATRYSRFHRLHAGQLVLSRLFAFEGAVAIVPPSFEGYYLSQEFPTFRTSNGADVGYLAHICRWPGLWEQLAAKAGGLGVRRKRVHAEQFLTVRVPLPDVEEQRRLASWLDRLFACLDRLEAFRSRRERLLASIPAALAHRPDMTDSQKRLRGWREVALGHLLEPTSDEIEVELTGEYTPVGIYSFGRGLFRRESINGSETKYRRFNRLHAGELIVSRLNGWEGAVDVVTPEFDGCVVSQEYPTFAVDREAAELDFLRALVRAPAFWESLLVGTRGSMVRRKRVHPDHVLATEIWLPPIEEQRRVARLTHKLAMAWRGAEGTEQRVDALKYAVLNSAFGGAA